MIRTLPRLHTITQDITRLSWSERWCNLSAIWSGARLQQKQQDELSKAVGIGRTSIVNIEAGRQVITLDGLLKFCEAFHITPKQILRGIWF